MMLFKLGVALLFSLWPTILAGPLLSDVQQLGRREYQIDDPSLPLAVKYVCSGGENATTVRDSLPLGPEGVFLTTGSCAPPVAASEDSSDDTSGATLAARQSCVTAPNDCISRFGTQYSGQGFVAKCGAPCSSYCYQGTNGPDPNDCQHMVDVLYTRSPLFTLLPYEFNLITYGSCGIGIQNQIAPSSIGCSQTMIYDWPDVAAVANYLAWNCQAAQGARGGRCVGNTGLYQPSVPDFYTQVYSNT